MLTQFTGTKGREIYPGVCKNLLQASMEGLSLVGHYILSQFAKVKSGEIFAGVCESL